MTGRALRAGLLYFAVVFALGFVLGTVRVLALAPVLGETAAVFAELPFILLFAWIAAGRIAAALAVPRLPAARLVMGGSAFALLVGAELALGLVLAGRGPADTFAHWTSLAGAPGLAGQVAFGLFPLLRLARGEGRTGG